MIGEKGDLVPADIAALTADTDAPALSRTLLAVAAMHEPDHRGRCRWCRPDIGGWRWWQRAGCPCPTRRVIDAHLAAAAQAEPRWTPA